MKGFDMQQELIEMLEKVVDHVVFCNGYDQRFTSTRYGVKILEEAGELVKKAKNSAKEPAVPQGWKLVPVEPTEEMLNAACQDGVCVEGRPVWKHSTAFQAKWKYQQMLSASPSQEPAQEMLDITEADVWHEGSKSFYRAKLLHKLTPGEVFSGPPELDVYTKPVQEVTLTDEDVNAAAKVLAERFDYPWDHMPEEGRKNMRTQARAVVEAALRAKENKL